MEATGEMSNFVKVWFSVIVSLSYTYTISKIVQITHTITKLLLILPIISLFLFLPLKLHTVHLSGGTAFFIAWLANFKLLLFAFNKGPLCSHSSISLRRFVAIGCLPIGIPNNQSSNQTNPSSRKPFLSFKLKGLILTILICVFSYYSAYMHPKVILFLYCFYIYLLLETSLAIGAALGKALLGVRLEPQFNEPYLSTSLQDFWGKRWNLMVTNILRPSVYEPTRNLATRVVGKKWAFVPAVFATFGISGIMHELMYYYLGRMRPTWQVTWFFVLHGLCLVAEIVLKKLFVGRFRLPKMISVILTIGFVMVTSFWLFFPQFLRCRADVRMFEEYAAMARLLRMSLGL